MNRNDALAAVFTRNAFYRRLHFLALAAFALSLLVIGFLIWVLIFVIKNPTEPLYFATDNVGRLVTIIPVDKPNMSTDDAAAWAIEALQAAYGLDYVNYRSQLQGAQKYFTAYGWGKFMSALTASNNLLALRDRKQVVLVQVVDQPKVLAQGILGGAYAWRFEMPVLVTYWEPPYNDKSKFYNPLIVNMIVQRQPILQSYKGLGIVQLIARFANSTTQPQEISSTPTG